MVKPEQVKEIRNIEITATDTKFKLIVPMDTRQITISFDIKDAQALRKELDEWIDIGTVVRATKQLARLH